VVAARSHQAHPQVSTTGARTTANLAAATVSADSSKSIPGRITEALPVDSFRETTSSTFSNYLQASVMYVKNFLLVVRTNYACKHLVQGSIPPGAARQNTMLSGLKIAPAIK
jgi:hypothetical protein